jgi:hypothetical protein
LHILMILGAQHLRILPLVRAIPKGVVPTTQNVVTNLW